MSPEDVKGYADIVISVLTACGFSSIVLAYIGMKKAKKDVAEVDDRPSIGMAGMQQLGGVLASDGQVLQLATAITTMAAAYTKASEERHLEAERERASEQENRAALRRLTEEIENVGKRLRSLEEATQRPR
jgi:hypothetical protein